MPRRLLYLGLLCALLTSPAFGDQVVTDWNWLQLPPGDVTHFIGNNGGATSGTGYGDPSHFRWGHYIWIPDGALTNSGAGDYFAGLQFAGGPREVENVRVQWWAQEGTSIKSGTVEGSTDGVNYSSIGTFDLGAFQTGQRFFANIDVTDDNYSHIRVHMQPGDYTFGSGSRGGPGIFAIEPFGDGSLREDKVNWANNDFGTTVANNGMHVTFNGMRYNDGDLYDDENVRTGDINANWEPGDYAQINLGTIRELNEVVAVWDFVWSGTGYSISTSTDGTNFLPVNLFSGPTQYAPGDGRGATGYTFQRVNAQYVRIHDATSGGLALLNQVLVFTPEPSSALMAVLGGMAMVAFRKRIRRAH